MSFRRPLRLRDRRLPQGTPGAVHRRPAACSPLHPGGPRAFDTHRRRARAMTAQPPLLEVRALARHYRLPRRRLFEAPPVVKALDGVSFTLRAGRNLGIVGESGSGKSTLGRLVMALETPDEGQVLFEGQNVHALQPEALR